MAPSAIATPPAVAPQIYKPQALNDAQIKIILDTVPILESAGETLTAKFYQRMFIDYPEVKVYFNDSDQKFLRQPRILAFALLNYAKNIQDLTPLTAFVKQIVSKHVGLKVKAEHYPCVGNSLIKTMGELLGPETATPEFVEAWSIAYGNLAQLLIGLENDEYQKEPWQDFRSFTVTKIEKECEDVKSVYFKPAESEHKIKIPKRGQYVCIRWDLPGHEQEKSREYSLSQFPTGEEYRISVRLLEGGQISSFVHNDLKVGDVLKVAPPNGNFFYEESDKDLVLIVGGIGITPIISILEEALNNGRTVTLLNSNRTVSSRPFSNYLKGLKKQYGDKLNIKEYFSAEKEALSPESVIDEVEYKSVGDKDLDFITTDHDVYLLGPRGYMKYVKTYLAGKGINDIKLEYFGPLDV
ncbi:flavohemoglobin [Scheffersomyces xylosifermentans]|uniref:flavohemoglobin n=1 Tax=Scheffersomyces xylosifermentans TaxID=1304137 RepID=UPI00315DBF37